MEGLEERFSVLHSCYVSFPAFQIGVIQDADEAQGGSALLQQDFQEYPRRSTRYRYMVLALRLLSLWLPFSDFLLEVFVHWARSHGLPG